MFRETLVLGDTERADGRPAEGTERLVLVVLSGTQVGQRFVLDRPRAGIGRDSSFPIQVDDDSVSREHAVIEQRDGRCLLRDLGSTNGTFVNGQRCEAMELQPGDRIGLGAETILELRLEDQLETDFEQRLFSAALYDGLTGAYNRNAFDRELAAEVSRALRHEQPLALLMLDLDHFKAVNDTHGHTAGDAVLREFVSRLEAVTRSEDYLARFGGEEFAMICTNTTSSEARALAERALAVVAGSTFSAGDTPLPVTVSIGVAELASVGATTPRDLIVAADAALYRAKAAGRARVSL